jgi:hypothetical protein
MRSYVFGKYNLDFVKNLYVIFLFNESLSDILAKAG